MRVVLYILILTLVLQQQALAAAPTRYTFDQCVKYALLNNDQIRSAGQEIKASEAKQDQTHPRGIPVVKYEHRMGPAPRDLDDPAGSFFTGDISMFNQFKVEVGSAITTFGKIKSAQELAAIGVEASWFKKEKTTNEIVTKMYQIYQGIILARELMGLAGQAKDAINGKIDELEKESTKDQIQILKMKVALYEIERRVEEAQKKEKLAVAALKYQMGFEDNTSVDVAERSLRPVKFALKPIDYYLEEARDHMPEYNLLSLGVRAKEKQLKLKKLDPVPNFGVGGFVDVGRAPGIRGGEDESSFTNPFNFTKAGVGFQLKGEFDYVKNTAEVRNSQAELLKTVYDKRAALGGLDLEIRKNYGDVQEAASLMRKSEEEKKAARQLVFLTKSNLDIGIGDRKDYLDGLQSYLVFQGRSFEAVYNYNVAVSSLKQKIGILYQGPSKELVP